MTDPSTSNPSDRHSELVVEAAWEHHYPGPRPKRGRRCVGCGRRLWRFSALTVFGTRVEPYVHRYCGQNAAYQAIPPNHILRDAAATDALARRKAATRG